MRSLRRSSTAATATEERETETRIDNRNHDVVSGDVVPLDGSSLFGFPRDAPPGT